MPGPIHAAWRRCAAVAAGATLLVAAGAGVAAAHVTANSPGATQGGYAVVTFRVPTESDTLSTTGLSVQLPTDTPLASVSVEPQPGWTYSAPTKTLPTPVTTDDGQVTEAVTQIDWTAADGVGIKPGEFAEFKISAGPMPEKDTVTFKAVQTYSDGSQVAWIETPAAGSDAEPEHPAPTLHLLPAATGNEAGSEASPAADGVAVSGQPLEASDAASPAAATTGIVLGAVAVVLAAAALVLTVMRGRRAPTDA